MECFIKAIAHYLPSGMRTNADLVALNPAWDEESIYRKTGIRSRPVVAQGETAADLATVACRRLLDEAGLDAADLDGLIFVSQSPDHVLPGSSSLLHQRLGMTSRSICFDINLACSGFVYAVTIARSLLQTGVARRLLLVFADTYSRYCDPHDLATVTLFGDGAAAVLMSSDAAGAIARVGDSVLGTDGRGYDCLIVPDSGARRRSQPEPEPAFQRLRMDGPEVFRFALERVKPTCDELLARLNCTWDDVDQVLCHQANRFMLDSLRKKLDLPVEKLPIDVEEIGNLSTASLPVFLSRWWRTPRDRFIARTLVVGFGVGFSWGAVWLEWLPATATPSS
jgi:3-oxoacyl-[acyl-carrier-protein] synthase III